MKLKNVKLQNGIVDLSKFELKLYKDKKKFKIIRDYSESKI